jgi:hypothetical protein
VGGEMGWAGDMCLPSMARVFCLVKFDVVQGVGAPNQLMAARDWHWSAG